MRRRLPPEPAADPPPLALLRWRWSGADPQPPGELVGAQAHRSRRAWLAARREWEAERGQRAGQWFAEARAAARAERGFGGYAQMRPYRPDPDELDVWEPCGQW